MRVAVVAMLVLTLGVTCVALYYIHCLEGYLESPSWNRKRAAWILMTVCLTVGVYDVAAMVRDLLWPDLLFVTALFAALSLYTDSYRLLLRTIKKVDALAALKR